MDRKEKERKEELDRKWRRRKNIIVKGCEGKDIGERKRFLIEIVDRLL